MHVIDPHIFSDIWVTENENPFNQTIYLTDSYLIFIHRRSRPGLDSTDYTIMTHVWIGPHGRKKSELISTVYMQPEIGWHCSLVVQLLLLNRVEKFCLVPAGQGQQPRTHCHAVQTSVSWRLPVAGWFGLPLFSPCLSSPSSPRSLFPVLLFLF